MYIGALKLKYCNINFSFRMMSVFNSFMVVLMYLCNEGKILNCECYDLRERKGGRGLEEKERERATGE